MQFSLICTLTRRFWLLGIVALCSVISLTGCHPENFRTQAAQVPQLVFAMLGEPSTFNAPLNQSAYNVFGYLYDGLLTENGLTGKLEPAIAESWEIAEDKKRIIFTLRPGLKWSDGQPLTADDVIFTYQDIYLNEKIPTDIRDILRIGKSRALPSVKKIDNRRVEFTVTEPFAPFLRYTGGLPILPKHALEASIKTKGSDGNPKFISTWGVGTNPKEIIGSGPYVIESYTPSQRVILRRNPYYWRKDAQGNSLPYIDRIVLQIIESTDNQLVNFRSGQLDSLEVQPEAFSLIKKQEKQGKFTIYNAGVETGTTFLSFNLNKAKNSQGQVFVNPIKSRWFNNVAFRQAIAYAIDRQTMKNNVFRGLGELENSPISAQSPYYLAPKDGLKVYNYNPEKAKQLLLNAGFKYNSKGELLDDQGNRVRFTLLTNSERKSRVDMASQIKQDLSKIGIQVDLQILSFNTYVEKLGSTRDWEAYLGGFTGGGVEPYSGNNIWSSQGGLHTFNQGHQPGEPPLQEWEASNWEKEIDRIFIAAAQELDETKRKALYGEFQKIVQEQLPFIHLVERLSLNAVRDRVEGIKFSALGGPFWNLYELKVKMD